MSSLEMLEYCHGGITFQGRLAKPAETGLRPAVLVAHHGPGQSQFDFDRSALLADAGYYALAIDMYGFGMSPSSKDAFIPLYQEMIDVADLIRNRMRAAYDALRSVKGVDPDRISAIGFCFGGQCALELARSGADLTAAVSFHGVLSTKLPAKKGSVRAKLLVMTGALDPWAPANEVADFQQEMTEAEADWHLTVYGKGEHGFTNPLVEREHALPGIRYDAMLDRLSWQQAMAFLKAANFGN